MLMLEPVLILMLEWLSTVYINSIVRSAIINMLNNPSTILI
jgi:hypothetical protein